MDGERINLIAPELRAYVDQAIDTAHEIALDAMQIEAVAIIRSPDDSLIFPFGHLGDSAIASSLIRGVARQMDATSIFIVAEAWMVRGERNGQAVCDMPGHRDVIFFHVETETGIWSADSDIAPWDENHPQPREFRTPYFHVAESTGGLFSGMLPCDQRHRQ